MPDTPPVREMRLVVTAADYDQALRFYREVLGLPERAAYSSPGGRVSILEAGRATLELADPPHAAFIDEVEVGHRAAGHLRVAFGVPDSRGCAAALAGAGARLVAEPTRTPWDSLNARLDAPGGLHLTLFTDQPDAVAAAGGAARAAAQRAGVRIADLESMAQLREAAALLARVWRYDAGQQPLAVETMRALAHCGNYVAGAYRDDRLIGTAVGFRGEGHLHSHITGVDPAVQAAGVGYALKQHQRAWSLAHDIPEVHWTFDPLIRRNAHFNLHKLGATATGYLPDFYGPMLDGINRGDASDRLYVRWRLTSARAVAAAAGERVGTEPAGPRPAEPVVLLDRAAVDRAAAGAGGDERPVPGRDLPGDGRPARVAVPADIEGLRARDRSLAAAWREAVRGALTAALGAGYQITGVAKDGFYELEKAPA
jgi:predicted GNAT superfamily acetyltransferase/predicted enzyme related to lactoylglutathione lyase